MFAAFGVVLAIIAAVLRAIPARPAIVIWLLIAAVILIGVDVVRLSFGRPYPWQQRPQA